MKEVTEKFIDATWFNITKKKIFLQNFITLSNMLFLKRSIFIFYLANELKRDKMNKRILAFTNKYINI